MLKYTYKTYMKTKIKNRQYLRRLISRADELELSASAHLRLQWFLYCASHGGNVSLTCRHFGIARSTFLRWSCRFDPKNPRTLEEHSRCPHAVRVPETVGAVIELIRAYRLKYPTM